MSTARAENLKFGAPWEAAANATAANAEIGDPGESRAFSIP
tara:strand:- start:1147 stop:1269 length:123 start_codon:yes stop_codon:yes gene_type:complete